MPGRELGNHNITRLKRRQRWVLATVGSFPHRRHNGVCLVAYVKRKVLYFCSFRIGYRHMHLGKALN